MPLLRNYPLSFWPAVTASLLVGGCATLPSSGPTAHQIERRAADPQAPLAFRIVDLTPASLAALDPQAEVAGADRLAALARASRADLVGPGDVLQVSIYEVGVALFGGGGGSANTGVVDPSAHGEKLPPVTVNAEGTIQIPYAGTIRASGRTVGEIARAIDQQLRGKSQSPQTVVTLTGSASNAVYVFGDVHKPGRVELTLSTLRLLDVIAQAGGSEASAEDSVVRVTRDGRTVEQRLSTIATGGGDDLLLAPGDRVELVKRPRTFLVFGATSHVAQFPFDANTVSLAEAVARAAGPNDAAADPSAIFVFRNNPAVQQDPFQQQVIYRLNMLEPASYFVSQRFQMHDKDVIYIANARSNQASKFVAILNQLFSPLLTARALSK